MFKKTLLFLVLISLVAGIAGFWLWSTGKAASLPGISLLGRFKQGGEAPTVLTGSALLEKENLELKRRLEEKENLLQQTSAEKQALQEYAAALEQKVAALEKQSTTVPASKTDYRRLAEYFAGMKPAVAVAIMDHMNDETVLGILLAMDNEQAAKILAAMQPQRAAALSSKITQSE